MTPRIILAALLGGSLLACGQSDRTTPAGVPQPKEIIDLGALVTEDLPQRFWGKKLMTDFGFTESNSFNVIPWEFGPVSGTDAYYTLFNHAGPHVDAPNHMGLGGGLDSYSIESFAGPLKVLDFSDLPVGRSITQEMVEDRGIEPGDIVVIYTGFTPPRSDSEVPETIALMYEAAEYLANIPVRAFGTDSFSVWSMTDKTPVNAESEVARAFPTHHAFLSRGIAIYEQLVNVERLLGKERMYFVGAPLNIQDGDGMGVRPVVLVY